MIDNQLGRDGVATPAHARGRHALDESAHLDSLLMAELSKVNYQLSRYVLRHHDADAGRAEPVPVGDEEALAACLSKAAGAIRARVERRSSRGDFGVVARDD